MICTTLHMGLPKTGSTTIQAFFKKNRQLLQKQNILYPFSLGGMAHRKLLALAGHSAYKKYQCNFCSSKKKEIIEIVKSTLQQELKEKNAERVILSCEGMPRGSSAHFKNLRKSLESIGLYVNTILLFVRPQAEWRRSVIQQRIKVGIWDDETVYPVDEPESCGKYGCYRDHVERRAEAFGMETIKLRLFGPEYFKDGDFYSEIREAFDLPEAPYELDPPSNESLSDFACYMLMHINKALPRYKSNGKECPRRLQIRKLAAKYFTASGNGVFGKNPLSSEIIAKYDSYYKESNEWICHRFFPERSRLFNTKVPSSVADGIPWNLEARAKEAAEQILSLRRNSEVETYFLELQKNLLSMLNPLEKISDDQNS